MESNDSTDPPRSDKRKVRRTLISLAQTEEQKATLRPTRSRGQTAEEPMPVVGKVFDDKFVVIDLLGNGSVTTAYAAQDLNSQEFVVIKVFREAQSLPAKSWLDFKQQNALIHENIEHVLYVSASAEGCHYTVTELLKGVSLKDLLDSVERFDAPDVIVSILLEVCDAVEFAHQNGVGHQALRPSNIILVESEDEFKAKVTDFGIGNLDLPDDSEPPADQDRSNYLSPEQLAGQKARAASDVYALGLITYEMVTGRLPIKVQSRTSQDVEPIKDSIPDLRPDMPGVKWLDHWLQQALEEDLNWRISTVKEFRDGLNGWLEIIEREARRAESPSDVEISTDEEKVESTIQPIEENETPETIVEPAVSPDRPQIEPAVDIAASQQPSAELPETGAVQDEQSETADSEETSQEEVLVSDDDSDAPPIIHLEERPPQRPPQVSSSVDAWQQKDESTKSQRDPRQRKGKGTSSRAQLKKTITSMIALKNKEMAVEDSLAMQFTGTFSTGDGTARVSPKATATRIGALVAALVLITGLIFFNFDSLKTLWLNGARRMAMVISPPTNSRAEVDGIVDEVSISDEGPEVSPPTIATRKAPTPGQVAGTNAKKKLVSASARKLKLNEIESATPLASEYYRLKKYTAGSVNNRTKIGNRRRIDYEYFDKNWLR